MFEVLSYTVWIRSEQGRVTTEAVVKLEVEGEHEHRVAEGDGPINALDRALREALMKYYPGLRDVSLIDYKVTIADPEASTAARTRVLVRLTDGVGTWSSVGIHENVVEASFQALVDAIKFYYHRSDIATDGVPTHGHRSM